MEQALHRSIAAGAAAAVATAGLVAVAPAAAPRLDLSGAAVQLTAAAVDDFDAIANATASLPLPDLGYIADALAFNAHTAVEQASQAVTAIMHLDTASAMAHLLNAVFQVVPAMPENVIVGLLGGMEGFVGYENPYAALTSWADILPTLTHSVQTGLSEITSAVTSLLHFDLGPAAFFAFEGFNQLVIQPFDLIFLQIPALLGCVLGGCVEPV